MSYNQKEGAMSDSSHSSVRLALFRSLSRPVRPLAGTAMAACVAASLLLAQSAAAADPPALSVNDVTLVEGNTGTTEAWFMVTLSQPAASPVTVQYATADGTARAGADYTELHGAVTFSPGTVKQRIGTTVNGDTWVEGNETFVLNLSNPNGATLGDAQGVATILDDESTPKPPLQSNWAIAQQGVPSINGSAYGAGKYVLVGSAGAIQTSDNGADWTSASSDDASHSDLNAVIYADGRFMAVGNGAILTSTDDGASWQKQQSDGRGSGVAFGNGRFVVVEQNLNSRSYRSRVSTDHGVSWQAYPLPTNATVQSVAYGNGVFVAVAAIGPPPP